MLGLAANSKGGPTVKNRFLVIAAVSSFASAMLLAAPALAQGGAEPAAEPKAPPAAAPAAEGPTDAQIAMIVVVANQVDIDAAKLAKSKSKNKDVKAFAATMIKDHEAVNKQAKALVKKLKVKPEESPTSKSLADGGKENCDN